MKINRLPVNDQSNGWSADLPLRTSAPALTGDIRSDWLVLGAGYAGLAAARRLAENCPHQQVALVDAGEIGENSSGRNSGFAIDLPHNVGSSLNELDHSHRFMRLARSAIDQLDHIVQTHSVPCEWSRDGRYHAAVSDRGVKNVLEPYARELEALGESFEWINKEDLQKKIGSNHFTSAVFTPGGALMNPAALTRGLADTLPANVTLYEKSPVHTAHMQNGIELISNKGSIRAPKMILAANGYSEQFGYYSNRLIHVVAFGSLTRPLNDEQLATYGVQNAWGLTPANSFAGITMRFTNDKRILIRQGLDYLPSQVVTSALLANVRLRHKKLFNQRFPMLHDVELDKTWSGIICLSRNSAPGFGQLAHNVWSAVCQNGMGVTKGTFSGTLAADMATGENNSLIAEMHCLGEPDPLPPKPFVGIGVHARFAWELFSNRHEA